MFESTALHSWTKTHLTRKDISVNFFLLFYVFPIFFLGAKEGNPVLMCFSCVLLFSDVWPMNTTEVGEGEG